MGEGGIRAGRGAHWLANGACRTARVGPSFCAMPASDSNCCRRWLNKPKLGAIGWLAAPPPSRPACAAARCDGLPPPSTPADTAHPPTPPSFLTEIPRRARALAPLPGEENLGILGSWRMLTDKKSHREAVRMADTHGPVVKFRMLHYQVRERGGGRERGRWGARPRGPCAARTPPPIFTASPPSPFPRASS